MTSRPESPGRPRSMIATSSGYSVPANSPSSPSRATSTVKPAVVRRALSVSRNAASSSTTSTRMPPLYAAPLLHRAALGVHTHGPYPTGVAQKPQHVNRAAAVFLSLCLDDARAEALLHHHDGLVHRH